MLGRDNQALLLSQVMENVTVGGGTDVGVQEVGIDRIVGTENRGEDFSRDFHPRKRWLASRWIAIHGLMTRSEFHEPISVIEVGGTFFVRDGHHRVSVAKALNKEFLPASVTRYNLPFSLPRSLDRNKLPLIRAKAQFHRNTGVFEILDEKEFFVACPTTWEWLEKEICEYNRAWFVRRFSRRPKNLAEQVTTWNDNLYHNAIDFIRRNSLTYLFPGKRETDIFVEMIRLWNSYDNPDEEYRQFAAISQVEEIVPGFRPLPKEKGFYRFLYRELVHRLQSTRQATRQAPSRRSST